MDHLETALSRDPPHNQLPNADTTAYTSKILLKGPIYSTTGSQVELPGQNVEGIVSWLCGHFHHDITVEDVG